MALKSLLKHIPVYEESLQKIINFDIGLLKGSDFQPNYSDNLAENLNDIKNIFDEIQLYFSKKQQKQEVYEVMEHTKKIISTLIDVVRIISEKK